MRFNEYVLEELFEFPAISSGMTEDFARRHPGPIPVYGGKKTETALSHIQDEIPGVRYFENCLAWNREGSIGYVFHHRHRFTTNDHHRPMILKEEYKEFIDLDYCQIVIENAILTMGLTWGKTASKEKVSKVIIKIPVDESGNPDIQYQIKYAKKLNTIQKVFKKLEYYYQKLDNSILAINSDSAVTTLKLSDENLFSLSIGKRVLKKDVLLTGIPLYSANPLEVFGYVQEEQLKNFGKPSILWGIDGKFVWNYIDKNQVFSITDHCGRLQILDDNINPKYVYYYLRKEAPNEGFSRTYRASIKRMKETISIEVPIDEDGNFDLEKQDLLVEKYERLEALKSSLEKKLYKIISSSIDFN